MKLLILGNGTSRLNYKEFIKNWKYNIWVCNYAFIEYSNFPRLDLIGTVHSYCYKDAIKFKEEQNLNNIEIIYLNNSKNYLGYSTGNELINEAIIRGYDEIYLLGYDSINNLNEDIYTIPYPYIGNFKNQFKILLNKYNCLKLEKIEKDIFIIKNKK